MSLNDRSQRFAHFGRWLAELAQPIVPLVTRLFIGHAFVLTGLGKWRNFENTVAFFTNIGIPAPKANAAFVASLELVGGALLILGFGTRAIAALLSSTMIVALMTADRADFVGAFAWGGADKGFTDIAAFVFLMFLAWLVAFGPGPISADRIVFKPSLVRSGRSITA